MITNKELLKKRIKLVELDAKNLRILNEANPKLALKICNKFGYKSYEDAKQHTYLYDI